MDENSFVEYLKSEFPFSLGKGIGDDAAIIKKASGFQLITKDILVEKIHFDHAYFSPEEIAIRALGANLSDIAAMGGEPEYFFLGLGFPEHYKGEKLNSFFKGLKGGCKKWGVELAGGDLSFSPDSLFISITMVGSSPNPVSRDGACAGDLIGISRVTGESAIGLKLLTKGIDIQYYSGRHKDPHPEISGGLVFSEYVSSMIDISDGLLIDLGRILKNSGKGAQIEYKKIPVTDDMRMVCDKYDLSEIELVLSGGEDFALLFTIPEAQERYLKERGIEYHIIGNVLEGEGIIIEHQGEIINPEKTGFDHLK